MDGATKSFLKAGISQSNAEAKALANYLVIEVIDDFVPSRWYEA